MIKSFYNDVKSETVLLQDISATGVPEISGNNLAGSAQLDDFTLKLKWSTVGNFHMSLIQV